VSPARAAIRDPSDEKAIPGSESRKSRLAGFEPSGEAGTMNSPPLFPLLVSQRVSLSGDCPSLVTKNRPSGLIPSNADLPRGILTIFRGSGLHANQISPQALSQVRSAITPTSRGPGGLSREKAMRIEALLGVSWIPLVSTILPEAYSFNREPAASA